MAIPVIRPVQQRSVGVVYRKTMTASPNIRLAVNLLRDIAAELPLPRS